MERSIRVLFMLPNLRGGGAERVVLTTLGALDSARVRPSLYVWQGTGAFFGEVPQDLPFDFGTRRSGHYSYALPSILAGAVRCARETDIVVGALELGATYLAYATTRMTNRPVIGWVHTNLDHYLPMKRGANRAVGRAIYPRLDAIVAPTSGSARSVESAFGVNPAKTRVFGNSVDLDAVRRASSEVEPAWMRDLAPQPVVVSSGRLVNKEKGFDVLIRAHARLIHSGERQTLVILGEGPDRCHLESLARSLGVGDSVLLPGFTSNPFPIIRAATLFVSPSRLEGFGLAIAESLAIGTPVIATDCPSGPSEVLSNGQCGHLVPTNDPAGMAAAIASLLRNEDKRAEFSDRGFRSVERYAPDRIAERWMDLFETLHRTPRS